MDKPIEVEAKSVETQVTPVRKDVCIEVPVIELRIIQTNMG
jgi:hypothetical protein